MTTTVEVDRMCRCGFCASHVYREVEDKPRHMAYSLVQVPGLKRERMKAGLSRRELEERSGYALSSIRYLESGEQRIRPGNAQRLARAIGCTVEDLKRPGVDPESLVYPRTPPGFGGDV